MKKHVEDIININVIIADRPYPLKIRRSEEEGVRKAAKAINDKVLQFQQVYAAKDKQDYLAMTALMYAVKNIENQQLIELKDSNFEKELSALESILSL